MLKVAVFIALMGSSFWGVADTVRVRNEQAGGAGLPSLDIEGACRGVANNDLNRTKDYSGCVSDERSTREQVRKEWASYSSDTQDQCLHLVTPPALPSYVTLQQCLHISRDAQKLGSQNGPGTIGKTMEAPSK
jgi:hypothetical protein